MAFTSPYRQHNYMGEHANDATALTFIQAVKWDSAGNGTGTPRNGMVYYNTTLHLLKVYQNGAWSEIGEVAMDEAWTPQPIGQYAAQSTRAGQAVYEGGAYYLDHTTLFNRVLIRLTAATPASTAGRLLIMQTANGKSGNAGNLANLKATCPITVPGTGAQNVEITPSEGTVTLLEGLIYIIWGETVAGFTMRTYGVNNYDLCNQNMQAGYIPVNFATNIAIGGTPATLNPLLTGDGGQTSASTNNVSPVVRLRKV